MTDATIEVRDLRKTYRDGLLRRRRIEALRGVSFEVQPGEIFGLLGPNGAGKTTVIKVLLGIVRRTDGEASMLGKPAGDRATRARVGYLPEHHRIPRHLTGNTAMEYYGGLSGMALSEVRPKREELLKLVGLEDWGDVPIRKYSKGMQQRLGLAQAMLHDPELLILDEPTDGVDPVGRSLIRQIMKRLKDEGKTVLVNSHLLQEIELVCDRVAILDRGLVQRTGSVAELTGRAVPGEPGAATALEISFVLLADEARARAALAGHKIEACQAAGDGQLQLTVVLEDQAAVDRAIDQLRAAGVSIAGMTRRTRTLEEAFIDIVTNIEIIS